MLSLYVSDFHNEVFLKQFSGIHTFVTLETRRCLRHREVGFHF